MIEKKLKIFKNDFDKELNNFFDEKIKYADIFDEISKDMLVILKDFTMNGGKRIRPALLYYGYKCFEKKIDKKKDIALLKAGLSIELMQSFLLIHDDIIDNDELRRNNPTVHKIYEKKYGKIYGKSFGILAGDLAVCLANESILLIDVCDELKVKIGLILNNSIQKVIYGQELDTLSTINKIDKTGLFKIHNLKTAKYTFEAPLLMGGALSNASEKDIEVLREYSYKMGIAFQLQDDILGLYGDEKKLGKPIGSDLKEGKKTLLFINAIENSSSFDKKYLNSVLGNKNIPKDDIKKVQKIVESSGSLAYSKKLIFEMANDAKNIVNKSNFEKDGKQFLIELTDYLINRES